MFLPLFLNAFKALGESSQNNIGGLNFVGLNKLGFECVFLTVMLSQIIFLFTHDLFG